MRSTTCSIITNFLDDIQIYNNRLEKAIIDNDKETANLCYDALSYKTDGLMKIVTLMGKDKTLYE